MISAIMLVVNIVLFWPVFLIIAAVFLLAFAASVAAIKLLAAETFLVECWTCSMVNNILDATVKIVDRVYSSGIIAGCQSLLAVFFAVWIVYYTMKYVGSLSSRSPAEYWVGLAQKMVLVAFLGILLSSTQFFMIIFGKILFPFLTTFLEVGLNILNSSPNLGGSCNYTPTNTGGSATSFLEGFKEPLNCIVKLIHQKLSFGQLLGIKMVQNSSSPWIFALGLTVYIFFLIFIILFPLQIFETIFKMAISFILFPLGLLFYAFKGTRDYSNKLFSYLFFGAVHFAVLCLMFSICIAVMINFMMALDPTLFDTAMLDSLSSENLRRMSSLEYRELALIAMLFYTYYLMNAYMEMVAMVTGSSSGGGDAMSQGVKGTFLFIGGLVMSLIMRKFMTKSDEKDSEEGGSDKDKDKKEEGEDKDKDKKEGQGEKEEKGGRDKDSKQQEEKRKKDSGGDGNQGAGIQNDGGEEG